MFDSFANELELQRQTGDDGAEIDMLSKYLCLGGMLKSIEDGIQRSYFKQSAPFGNGIHIQYY